MEGNKNSAISVRNVCIDYKSLKTGSIKQNFFKLKKVEQEVFHAVKNVSFEVRKGRFLELPEERKWKVYDASCNRRNFLCG